MRSFPCGNSIVNRSFYGVRPLTTRDGLYTNAVYGFVTTLQRLLEEERPEEKIFFRPLFVHNYPVY